MTIFSFFLTGKWKNSVDCAVKTLKSGTMSPEAFLEEARIMHKLRHRKLVQLIAVCSTQEPIYIITELMCNGALLDYLRKNECSTNRLTIYNLVEIAAQVKIFTTSCSVQTKCLIDDPCQLGLEYAVSPAEG